jgi:cytochrome c551
MIKVLTAALVGTIIGIIVMVVVIALSGTDTSGASSVGLGSLPVSTFSASSSTASSGGTSTPPASSGGSSGGSSSGGSVSGDPANGQSLFVSKTCSGCHANAAGQQSPFPAAPNLADLNASGGLTESAILNQIQHGGGGMPPNLASGQDAQDLAAYILTLGK